MREHFVDTAMRREAADAIRRFATGALTNDAFEDLYPGPSRDGAINAVYLRLWGYYDDVRTHRMTGNWALDEDGRDLWGRCVLFLESDVPYRWTTRTQRLLRWLAREVETDTGDEWIWPFFAQDEYRAALQRAGGALPLEATHGQV